MNNVGKRYVVSVWAGQQHRPGTESPPGGGGTGAVVWPGVAVAGDPTVPQGMDSDNSFLNALVVFQCDVSPDELKQQLNRLEEALGRDRSDPWSGVRDRPIDVDILEVRPLPSFTGDDIREDYYRQLLAGERAAGERLVLAGQPLGEAPATIDRDQRAGHEVIVQQGDNLLNHAVKSALPG